MVVLWAFNFVAMKVVAGQVPLPALALVRYLAMYAVMVFVCYLRGRSLRYERGDSWKLLGLGCLTLGVYMVLFFEGMQQSTAAEGAIILATSPIFTMLIAFATRQESVRYGVIIGALMAYAGVVVLILGGQVALGAGHLRGNLTLVVSAVVWAVGAVLSKGLVQRYSADRFLTLSMPGGIVVLLPYGLTSTLATHWSSLSAVSWLMVLHVALAGGVIGWLCFYKGVEELGPSAAMTYQFATPAVAAIIAWMTFGVALHGVQYLGFALVLCGVLTANRARS